jgi:predicted MFS family arabinose efflux permease
MACGLSSPAKRPSPFASITEMGRTISFMTTTSDANSKAANMSAIALGTLGVLSFIVQPALVQGFVTHLGMSEPEAVNLAGIEMLGVAISTVLLALPRTPFNWRSALAFGLILAILGNIASAMLAESPQLWIARVMAGLGHGAIISLSFTFVGLTARVDRNIALYLVALLSYGAIGLWVMPGLLDRIGVAGLFAIFAFLLTAGFATLRHVPASNSARIVPSPTARQLGLGLLLVGLLGVLAYNMAQGIAWAILFLVGIRAGHSEADVAQALFVSQIFAVIGALGSVFFAERISRWLAIAFGVLLGAAFIALMMGKPGLSVFLIAVCGFNLLWNFALPFILGAVSDFDERGRMMGPAIAMQMIGLGGGPLLAAQLIGGSSYHSAEIFCIVFFLASYVLLTIPMLRHRKLQTGCK